MNGYSGESPFFQNFLRLADSGRERTAGGEGMVLKSQHQMAGTVCGWGSPEVTFKAEAGNLLYQNPGNFWNPEKAGKQILL